MDAIKEHYKRLARTSGSAKDMSMKDIHTKDAEINEIEKSIKYLVNKKKYKKILEIGCGNGYTSKQLSEELNVNIVGLDYCEELIDIAKKRKLKNVNFCIGDVLKLDFESESFDIVYSERCLINLDSWQKQKKALNEIHRVLKKDGIYVMIECFLDGLDTINKARRVVGLLPIEQPFHNKYFDKKKLYKYIVNKFINFEQNDQEFKKIYKQNFLSSYYFGSRVLYPSIVKKGEVEYNNKFIEFFSFLEPYGNYSYIQLLVLQKKDQNSN